MTTMSCSVYRRFSERIVGIRAAAGRALPSPDKFRYPLLVSFLDQFFVYHPEPWQDRDWARLSGLPLEDVWFHASDGVSLFGWYAEAAADRPIILWCHGNAGNIINRLDNLKLLYQMGLSIFLFDYRGYGKSQSIRPSEKGLYQDAYGAYDYLTRTRKVRWERIVLFGRSLGASVAGELAVQRPASALILESSFPSIEAVARLHYGGFPAHWFLGAEFQLLDRLPNLSLPKLIIHGDKDDIIPIELGRQVFDAAKPPKEWYVIQGADHNNTYVMGGGAYFRRLGEFIRKALAAY